MNAITEVPNGALLSFIERAAKDETFDVAKFETLLRVRRDEAHDHARRVFNQAMAICQSEMEPVLRSTPNKGVGGKYAKLEDIDQQMRPIYTSHGFSVRFGSAPPPQPGWLRITCTVAHESGYFEENYLDSPVSNQGAQGGRLAMTPVQAVGSVVTYLRRYLLGMVFNIVQADVVGQDDDGEGQRDTNAGENMRAAAADTPRAPRVSEPPPKSTAAIKRTDAQWNVWVDKLEAAVAVLYRRSELDDLVWKPAFKAAKAEAPPNVRRDIDAILAAAYERLPAEPIENDPTIGGEELADVEIVGAEKLAAG